MSITYRDGLASDQGPGHAENAVQVQLKLFRQLTKSSLGAAPVRERRHLLLLLSSRLSESFSTSLFRPTLVPWRAARAVGVVKSQHSPVRLLPLEMLHALHRTLDVHEISMRKSSWLPGPSVDGDADIDHILYALEEIVQVTVGHLEGHVADKEGLGWWVQRLVRAGWVLRAVVEGAGLKGGVLDGEAAAFKELLVQVFDGSCGRLDVLEVDVAKSRTRLVSCGSS